MHTPKTSQHLFTTSSFRTLQALLDTKGELRVSGEIQIEGLFVLFGEGDSDAAPFLWSPMSFGALLGQMVSVV